MTTHSLAARRAGRSAFGIVLCLGMVALAARAVRYGYGEAPIHAWQILVGTWLAAFATAGVVRTLVGFAWAETTELDQERARIAAFVTPAIGLALIAPLTIHLGLWLILNLDDVGTLHNLVDDLEGFDAWTTLSLLVTGLAHITFAALVGTRAGQLARGAIPVSVGKIFIVTVLVSCVPGAVVIVPVVVVALTGIPIVPLLFWMEGLAARDRENTVEVPVAIARTAA